MELHVTFYCRSLFVCDSTKKATRKNASLTTYTKCMRYLPVKIKYSSTIIVPLLF